VQGVPATVAGLIGWLRANPNLVVGRETAAKIGGSIPATQIDVHISAKAVNDDPKCPDKPCANFLGYPGWDAPYGMAGKSVTRFLLADVIRDDKSRHVLVIAVEAESSTQVAKRAASAQPVIDSLRLPVTAG
jgi:hypothetical protein